MNQRERERETEESPGYTQFISCDLIDACSDRSVRVYCNTWVAFFHSKPYAKERWWKRLIADACALCNSAPVPFIVTPGCAWGFMNRWDGWTLHTAWPLGCLSRYKEREQHEAGSSRANSGTFRNPPASILTSELESNLLPGCPLKHTGKRNKRERERESHCVLLLSGTCVKHCSDCRVETSS